MQEGLIDFIAKLKLHFVRESTTKVCFRVIIIVIIAIKLKSIVIFEPS